eukprot:1008290-Prorocentrum_minimum.AAC.1
MEGLDKLEDISQESLHFIKRKQEAVEQENHCDSDCDCDCDSHCDNDSDCDSERDCDCHSHCDSDCDCDNERDSDSDCERDSDSDCAVHPTQEYEEAVKHLAADQAAAMELCKRREDDITKSHRGQRAAIDAEHASQQTAMKHRKMDAEVEVARRNRQVYAPSTRAIGSPSKYMPHPLVRLALPP